MKKLFLSLLGMLSLISLKAQSDQPTAPESTTKSVYVELGGSGLVTSVNFDSRFKGSDGFGFRVGVGAIPLSSVTIVTIPVGLNYITGKGSSHFEAEVTGTFLTATKNAKFLSKALGGVVVFPHVGYRYTKPTKSFFGRIYLGPLFFGGYTLPYAGISLGYTL